MIDLDVERAEPRAKSKRHRHRWLPVGIAIGLALVGVLGGAAVGRPAFRLVLSLAVPAGDDFDLIGDDLLVYHDARKRIDSYELPTGKHRWHFEVADRIAALNVGIRSRVLLMTTTGDRSGTDQLFALDAGTGQVRWRQDGSRTPYLDARNGGVLLVPREADANATMTFVDLNTGAERWKHPLAAGSVLAGERGAIVAYTATGNTEILDLGSGRVTAAGQLGPTTLPSGGQRRGAGLFSVGGLLLSLQPDPDRTVVTAFRSTTLARQWQVSTEDALVNVADCGPLLCFNAQDQVSAVDRSTGKVVWRKAAWTDAQAVGNWLQARAVRSDGSTIGLLQPTTGAVQLNLDGWSALPGSDLSGDFLVTRSETGRLGSQVGVGRPGQGDVRILDWLPGAVNQRCQTSDLRVEPRYLACPTMEGTVRVWRYRP